MAATEEHDENIPIQNIDDTNNDISTPVNEVQQQNICTIPTAGSNEILLYVGENASQSVQDLIRVALHQNLASSGDEGIQQQLQNVSAKITLQNIADTSAIISMPMPTSEIDGNPTNLLQSGANVLTQPTNQQVVSVVHHGDIKPIEMNSLFQLASLTDNLVTGQETIPEDISVGADIKPESIDDSINEDDGDKDTAISDFIITNIESTEHHTTGELNIGDEFYCLEAVEEALRQYEEKHDIKLYKRDVRSLEALLKRSLKLQKLERINESLKYGQLLYCCVFGGKRRAQKMACIDETGFARYTDCKMFIRFAISDDGMKLVVNGKEENHNHDTIVTNEHDVEPQYFTNPGNAEEIKLGAGFVDLEELYKAVHKYETDNHVHLWRRDGRTVDALAKRAPGTARKIMESNPGLKFAELRFCCSYGGRQSTIDEKKDRRSNSSFKQGCEMHIRFGISDDGSQLIVKSMSEEHNHEINEETIVKEALHPDLCVFVSRLVWNDLDISVDDVKLRLEDHVVSVMFKDQPPPPRTRRQYFPSKKQIRYFMTKAKASLNISLESEQKLLAQAEKLKEEHSEEKLIFNFKVHHEVPNLDEESAGDGDDSLLNQSASGLEATQNEHNAKVLFCHQTPHQQRILRRYNTQVILTQVNDLHSKIPFPLFCLYVQTNVDYQLVGEFIVQTNTNDMIVEGLQMIKEWNPGWTPKFAVVDFSSEQISAIETAFPNTFVLISDSSREAAWNDWLSMESNGVSEYQDDVIKYLESIANSYSEETLNNAARELEESDVWKMSDKMRNWFQMNWLAQAKRWVIGYRPDDYIATLHTGRSLSDELKIFKNIKLTNKSSPLQDLMQQLVEHVVPVAKKQYEILNKDSYRLQNDLYYIYSDIPNYLSNRPGKLTFHIHERLQKASNQIFVITDVHPGIFSVQGNQPDDDELAHTVSFGDGNSFPSCDCTDWQRYKLPCVHFCSIFITHPEWTWDMMSNSYRSSPVFSVDWSVSFGGNKRDTPGSLIDSGTQTSGANLISTTPEIRLTKIGDLQRVTEPPHVLATQCRVLLQQLSKLQLAHHSRENLNRLKAELKELISRFTTPQNTNSLAMSRLVMKGRKSDLTNTNQSVFDHYNVKLVTPKQATSIVENKVHEEIVKNVEITSDDAVVDSLVGQQVSSSSNLTTPATTLTIKAVGTPTTRKRVQSPSVFLRPSEKRTKREPVIAAKNIEIQPKSDNNTQFTSDASISTVIAGQTVNIPLEQITAAVAASLQGNTAIPLNIADKPLNITLEASETVPNDTAIK